MVLRKCLVLAVAAAAIVALAGSSAVAQRRGGPPGGFFGGPVSKLMLLENEEVRKELEIVKDQQDQLEKLRDDMRNQMREMFSGMRDLPDTERRAAFEKMRDKIREMSQEMEKKVDGILLPNQVERLNQLDLQQQLRRRGVEGAVGGEQLGKALGLTEDQKKRLAEVSQEVQKELQEKTEKLRQEAREKILKVLTAEQRAKLDKMLGEQFQMPDRFQRGPRGFRGPQPGPAPQQ